MRHELRTNLIFAALASLLALLAGCAAPPEKDATDQGPIVYPKPPDPPRFVYERTLIGTGSVRTLTDQDRLKSLLTGTTVRDGTGFAKPFDIAVRHGKIHVTDTVHRAVLVLDFAKGESQMIRDRGDDGDLHKPLGIAVDDAGKIYVVDASLQGIQVYTAAGDFERRIDLSKFTKRPSGIDVSGDGKKVLVVDTGGVDSDMHRVVIVDANSGELLKTIGTRGKRDGDFNLPRDVRVAPDGRIYVTDGGNFRVQSFTADGEFIKSWGQPGRRLGQFSRPKGITADKDGNIYVVDAAFGNFQIFNGDGELLLFIGERSTVAAPGKYMLPSGIDVDEDGRIYLIDQFFRKVDVFRPITLDESEGWLAKTPVKE